MSDDGEELEDYLNNYYQDFEADTSDEEVFSDEEQVETLQQQQQQDATLLVPSTTTANLLSSHPILLAMEEEYEEKQNHQFKWIEHLFLILKGNIHDEQFFEKNHSIPVPSFFKKFVQEFSTCIFSILQSCNNNTNNNANIYMDCIYFSISKYIHYTLVQQLDHLQLQILKQESISFLQIYHQLHPLLLELNSIHFILHSIIPNLQSIGQLLSFWYELCLEQEYSYYIYNWKLDILQHCLEHFYKQFSDWICWGITPCFISSNFTIDTNQLPLFLQSVEKQLFITGKSALLLRMLHQNIYSNHNTNNSILQSSQQQQKIQFATNNQFTQPSFTQQVTLLFEKKNLSHILTIKPISTTSVSTTTCIFLLQQQQFLYPLKKQYQIHSKQLLQLLTEPFLQHMHSIANIFLLAKGDVIHQLIIEYVNHRALHWNSILEYYSFYCKQNEQSIELTYTKLQWPYTLIIPSFVVYNQIFDFLFQIKLTSFELHSKVKTQTIIPLPHSFYMLTNELKHFIHTIEYYFMSRVMNDTYLEMIQQVYRVDDFSQLCELHEQFLEKLQVRCLSRAKLIANLIQKMMQHCKHLCKGLEQFIVTSEQIVQKMKTSTTEYDSFFFVKQKQQSNNTLSHVVQFEELIQQISRESHSDLSLLLSVIQKLIQQSSVHEHLKDLESRINYNNFY